MASTAMPEQNQTALEWCEYIFQAQGTVRMAYERLISYFQTPIEIGAIDSSDPLGDDEKEKWEHFLNNQINYPMACLAANRNKACYGNDFISIVIPFRRFLVCPTCKNMHPLKVVHENPKFKFRWEMRFMASCPNCHYSGEWTVKDEPESAPDKLKFKHWSPHEIHILHDPFTDDVSYLWKIPEDYKNLVRKGTLYHLERVSMQVLDAVKRNQMFKFAPNVIYHMKEPTLAGVRNRGWGISRLITNFRQVWYVQVLHRYNEAIALDYVIPFRLITPSNTKGSVADPLLHSNQGDQMAQIRRMVANRRRDPAAWNTLGFPVEYHLLGGDARALAPHELLDQGNMNLMDSIGIPMQLYKGDMQLQTAPVVMRHFEATFYHLVNDNNDLARWVVDRVSEILSWESVDVRHKRVAHADDMQRHMTVLQLMMGQVISMTTGLRALGLDWKDEQRLISEEASFQQIQQAEVQEEMDQSAFGAQIAAGAPPGAGGAPPGAPMDPAAAGAGGAPPAGGGGQIDPATGQPAAPGPVSDMIMSNSVPQTPEDMMAQAESIAQQLLGLPESQKDSELRALKQKNEVLHALVTNRLTQIRGQARSQGGQQLMAQQFGGGMGGPGQMGGGM